LPQRPVPISILDKKHRKYLSTALTQPIAAYDSESKNSAMIPWPPDLIVQYQANFIQGYALSQA
jgi:hypothetical protein